MVAAAFCLSHHFATGATACKAAKELSRTTQKRFRFENSGWKSPAAADPNRITLTRFGPSPPRESGHKLVNLVFVNTLTGTIAPSLATNCCWRRRHRSCRRRILQTRPAPTAKPASPKPATAPASAATAASATFRRKASRTECCAAESPEHDDDDDQEQDDARRRKFRCSGLAGARCAAGLSLRGR